mgnify:CR=1 FL=1
MGKLANPDPYAGIFLRVICHSFTRFSSQHRDRVTTPKKARGENATGKPIVTHGKLREKPGSSQQAASERVVVENNLLGATSSDNLDKAIEKI